jgi:hypothetical protein
LVQLRIATEELGECREGYLGMYRGVLKNLKKRCVRAARRDVHVVQRGSRTLSRPAGSDKMGGGTSTMGRKNWKNRWMTLRGGILYRSVAATWCGFALLVSFQHLSLSFFSFSFFVIFFSMRCWTF